jgi:hypothetical protein
MDRPRPQDADGFRSAWAEAQQRWTETIERARVLPVELLNESVDGETRTRMVDRLMTPLTDAELDDQRRVSGPGHPRAGLWPVRRCVGAVVNEEWRHRDYAERDLAKL